MLLEYLHYFKFFSYMSKTTAALFLLTEKLLFTSDHSIHCSCFTVVEYPRSHSLV